VGKNFTGKVRPEDREDFLHDLFLAFAKGKVSYDVKGKELTKGGLLLVRLFIVYFLRLVYGALQQINLPLQSSLLPLYK